ncbi:hypothetical protein RI367_000774 [Sorochytrium milnesiophthora]
MSSLSLQNALASAEMLESPPSRADGVVSSLEHDLRVVGCELIQSSAVLLKLPQMVPATAQTLLQRFYFLCSMKRFGVRDIVLGSLFLASKLEESPRRPRDIINVVHYVLQSYRRRPTTDVLDPYGTEFSELQDAMFKAEMHILKRLAFNVQVQQPYVLMINYVKALELSDHADFAQRAWNYLNDSLRTIVHVVYQPPTIACAAILLASRGLSAPLPATSLWCSVFDASSTDVLNAAGHILSLYGRKLRWDLPLTNREMESWLVSSKVSEADIVWRLSEAGLLDAEQKLAQREKDALEREQREKQNLQQKVLLKQRQQRKHWLPR